MFVLTVVEADFLILLPGSDVDEQALVTYFRGRKDMARTPLRSTLPCAQNLDPTPSKCAVYSHLRIQDEEAKGSPRND